MSIITRKSHDIKTKFHAVTSYRNNNYSVEHICNKYHISKASLMRWNKQFDGTKESLKEKSRRPKTPHPNSHTQDEITKILNLIKRNPKLALHSLGTNFTSNCIFSPNNSGVWYFLGLYCFLIHVLFMKKPRRTKRRYKDA